MVEGVDRFALLRRDREMKRIPGAQPERVLVDEARRRPEMHCLHPEDDEAFRDQPAELGRRCGAR